MHRYQSEDLTGQRHSMKCYPNQSEPPADYLSDVNTIGATVTSIIICAILATLAAGSCFVYVKRMSRQIILFLRNMFNH